jgi:hypothetical protein
MNFKFLSLGIIIIAFCLGIIFLPYAFNIGSIIGVGIFLIITGLIEKEGDNGK